ncbi:glucose-1-phosphate thymidylyltransferase RfbA [Hydrogenivirga sp. 128-5-R1-1]|uniref:glucose-1-phosphate thymidylyltransferase RfbA n=1 Tax=Hydrogenivirga sp. 128-5-R1-1 TaxID=392423 RepID=UPI00015EF863|nr:glucose-1-phosphate thymidylyltransferase RfbA [Hydrogenivirga sp. 128-5-R1-1]EDP75571.1 WblO protein [Hydrogenivirga sp. 128-5-R1-1]
MKGIILAGGSGTRLYPITKGINKHLLHIYDKPMIYYALSVLMLAKIKDILIITNPEYVENFENLLGNGSHIGINISYASQEKPKGIAEAFIIGEKFIRDSNVALILGDNLFYGQGFSDILVKAFQNKEGATIFAYPVKDPERFGIAEFDENFNVISLEEKPKKPKSNWAVTGLYFYDNEVVDIAKKINPSERGELEITSINSEYLKRNKLKVQLLGRGFAWFDAGTHESLLEASLFVSTIEKRQGYKIACIEEIAYRNGWINKNRLMELAEPLKKTDYGKYLIEISKEL